jgi:hypothetical protein
MSSAPVRDPLAEGVRSMDHALLVKSHTNPGI